MTLAFLLKGRDPLLFEADHAIVARSMPECSVIGMRELTMLIEPVNSHLELQRYTECVMTRHETC